MAKYVFVTGGVVSSLGKGITAASLGRLMKCRGLSVSMQKLDPYLNVDPGTMNPYQHGEVFVTGDGAETDLDLGHYERFTDVDLKKSASVTSGRVFSNVIQAERRGDYLGATVQIIPHVTDEIKRQIRGAAQESGAQVAIVEIGGTVGDIEGQPFLEAVRQMRYEEGPGNTLLIHVTLIPYLRMSGELKTKPTQHSVRELGSLGLTPDILVCRSEQPIPADARAKIAMFCNMPPGRVFQNLDAETLYEIPLLLRREGLDETACALLGFPGMFCDLSVWGEMVRREKACGDKVTVALVGKYVHLKDAYLSVAEALRHAGIALTRTVDIRWIDATDLTEQTVAHALEGVHGLVVPGGFGERGLMGKRLAIRHARENGIPFLGLCLGMQMAVIEFARNVLGLKDADTTEIAPGTPDPVISLLIEQNLQALGGTMRLGSYRCALASGSLARQAYGEEEVLERHRHRYEFNNAYRAAMEERAMRFSGVNPERNLAEIVELPDHPFFVGVQFHPEFKSRPDRPHPLFRAFLEAAARRAP
ncbi:MAG TPA: CTP synthase [Candidatus Limnocylindria bacterium]|nr:CTP synthase [Candidatus Limnocylindria bacterium]